MRPSVQPVAARFEHGEDRRGGLVCQHRRRAELCPARRSIRRWCSTIPGPVATTQLAGSAASSIGARGRCDRFWRCTSRAGECRFRQMARRRGRPLTSPFRNRTPAAVWGPARAPTAMMLPAERARPTNGREASKSCVGSSWKGMALVNPTSRTLRGRAGRVDWPLAIAITEFRPRTRGAGCHRPEVDEPRLCRAGSQRAPQQLA
jgi:hypothetical protein